MNRRTIIIAGLIIAFVAVLSLRGSAQPAEHPVEPEPIGRYQLCSGHYETLTVTADSISSKSHEGLFRLDTVTGEVLEYTALLDVRKGQFNGDIQGQWRSLPAPQKLSKP